MTINLHAFPSKIQLFDDIFVKVTDRLAANFEGSRHQSRVRSPWIGHQLNLVRNLMLHQTCPAAEPFDLLQSCLIHPVVVAQFFESTIFLSHQLLEDPTGWERRWRRSSYDSRLRSLQCCPRWDSI